MADPKYREPAEDRWGANNDRTEPVTIDVRTEWLYSERDGGRGDACICCPARHAFSRGGKVVRSDVPARYSSENDLQAHIHRAIGLFGDDADLVIEVRRRG